MGENTNDKSVFNNALADFLHDLKQPLNLIKVIAQDVRLDISKKRLELDSLPSSMKEIEASIENLVSHIDEYGKKAKEQN